MKFTLIFTLFMGWGLFFLPAQSYTSYRTGAPNDLVSAPLGGVTLMGGATENDNAMTWFLNRANGGDVLVLRYSGSDGYNNYFFSQLGVTLNSVETIVFNSDSAAYDPYVLQRINEAEAIWFAGGDQWDYVRGWRGSPVASTINAKVQTGMAVGGTSAGMAILGSTYFSAENGTITSATALANPYATNASVDTNAFLALPYLESVITDTHYDNPAREGRHLAFLARAFTDGDAQVRGIACDEFTGVCIAPDGKAYVYGEAPTYNDFAYFLVPNCELADPAPELCSTGQALTWNHNGAAVKVLVINGDSSGSQFLDLNDWQTAHGGTWENWSVDNGNWNRVPASAPVCVPTATAVPVPSGFALFPNPAQTSVLLQIPSGLKVDRIHLYNPLGQSYPVQSHFEGQEIQLDLRSLESGLYYIEVQAGQIQWTSKLLVQ